MTNVQVSNEAIAPNAKRLLVAGFMAILAAGMGFAIRGGIFNDWVQAFNFTGLEIGLINGAGFTGFCFGIIIGGVIADKIGYGKLVAAAFVFHVVSALVTFGAMPGMASFFRRHTDVPLEKPPICREAQGTAVGGAITGCVSFGYLSCRIQER